MVITYNIGQSAGKELKIVMQDNGSPSTITGLSVLDVQQTSIIGLRYDLSLSEKLGDLKHVPCFIIVLFYFYTNTLYENNYFSLNSKFSFSSSDILNFNFVFSFCTSSKVIFKSLSLSKVSIVSIKLFRVEGGLNISD